MTDRVARRPARRATLIGFTAVLMWSFLALFTAASGHVPPLQLTAMTFAVGGGIGLVSWLWRPRAIRQLAQPATVWLIGVGGLFGYHAVYFLALRNAPAVEAGLIAYLSPLLIVVGSALLPGERFGWHHLAGVLLGLAGTVLIVTGGQGLTLKTEYTLGYLAALACAVIWASYSLLSRRLATVSTDVVTGFCLATALLSLIGHLMIEQTVWPAGWLEWLAVLGLGLGPVGAAFYTWDHGVKHGDIQVLGASFYAAPLISTILLVLTGFAAPSWIIAIACLAITGGAALAAKDLLLPRRPDA